MSPKSAKLQFHSLSQKYKERYIANIINFGHAAQCKSNCPLT